jgi:mono/diheme cytochrome c family protein
LQTLLSLAFVLISSTGQSVAQNIENGRRLAERWCTQCHAINPGAAALKGVTSFASVAMKKNVTAEMVASFLLLPHATMPNFPLSRDDARDIAAFILETKN